MPDSIRLSMQVTQSQKIETMKQEINYEVDVSIDPDSLDTEWLAQPRLMIKYSQLSAQARAQYETAKTNLDIVKAELDKEIRKDPEKFEVYKITEGAIFSAIIIHSKYKEAMDALQTAQYEMNIAISAVSSIDSKKTALENLVRLHGMQYFAGPSVPRDLSKEWERKNAQKESNKKIKFRRK